MLDDWYWTIGEVVSIFGIKGELKVRLETDFPDRFRAVKQVCLRPPAGEPRLYRVQSVRLHKGQALLKIEGVNSATEAERLRGGLVQVQRTDAVRLPKDSYYSADLVGFEVVTRDGRALGRLEDVLRYPGHDLFRVGDILIPAVKQIVIEVDVADRRIVVDPPEGMIPEELMVDR